MSSVTDYQSQLTRARRNFALCVLQIQAGGHQVAAAEAIRHEWRVKADRLQSAILYAKTMEESGAHVGACQLLKQENEPR
jgi:hypothetical protein